MRHDTILTSTGKKRAAPLPPSAKVRISAQMRKAMELRINTAGKITEICQKVGMSESNWHKNMKRPEYQAAFEQLAIKYIQGVNLLKARHKARAYEVAAELMETATSEAVRMRAVEFFAGETKGPSVQVTVNTDNSGKYAYARPGQRVVDITPDDDDGPDHSATDS